MRPYPSGGCGVGFPLHSRRHFRFYVCLAAMMTLDLTDDEKLALAAELKRTIAEDRYPLSPRIRTLKAILARVEPPFHRHQGSLTRIDTR
jgi:hypothetical protein